MSKLALALLLFIAPFASAASLELTQTNLQLYIQAFQQREQTKAEVLKLSEAVRRNLADSQQVAAWQAKLEAYSAAERELASIESKIAFELWPQMGLPGTDVYPSTLYSEQTRLHIRFLSRAGKNTGQLPDLLGAVSVSLFIEGGRVVGYEAFAGPLTQKYFNQ